MFTDEAITNQNNRNRRRYFVAASYLMIATAVWALVPLVIDITSGSSSPFLFNGGWRLGGAIGCLGFILARYRSLFFVFLQVNFFQHNAPPPPREIRRLFVPRTFIGWSIPFAVFGKFEFVIYAYATQLVATYAVAVTYETWPIIMISIMVFLFKNENRYQKTGIGMFFLLVICLIGTALVIIPEQTISTSGFSYLAIVLSIAAALVAGSHNAVMFKWGNVLGKQLDKLKNNTEYFNARSESEESLITFSTVLGQYLAQSICMILCFVIGFSMSESIDWSLLLFSIAGGALASGMGDVFFRKANTMTDDIGLNALTYLTPVFAFVWLFIFSEVDVVRADYLVLGTIAIIISNMLIHFESEIRSGFKSLMIALWTFGLIAYTRESIFNFFNVTTWNWVGDGYFETVAVSATVFTLLIAFRVARLVNRINDEAVRIVSIYRMLEPLTKVKIINEDVLRCIRAIDKSKKQSALRCEYTKARSYIANATPQIGTDREILNQASIDLDVLVRSKQTGLLLGEMFAIVIFAGITISLALSTNPSGMEGWIRLQLDLFAVLISSVIIFLIFYVFDLDHERNESKFEEDKKTGDYFLRFPNIRQRAIDQWISFAGGVAIVGVYIGLLADKWL